MTKIRQGSHQSAPVNGNTIKKISVYNKGIALDQNGETGLGVVALEVIYVHIYKHSASKETGSYKPKRNAATIILFIPLFFHWVSKTVACRILTLSILRHPLFKLIFLPG